MADELTAEDWADALRQALAQDPAFGSRYRAAADKRPFLDELARLAGGTVVAGAVGVVTGLVDDIVG